MKSAIWTEPNAQAINKIIQGVAANRESIIKLSDHLQSTYSAYPEKVLVESGNRMISLALADIIWIEADGDYTRIHTAQKFYISSYGISVLEQKLNPSIFVRIHRSALINTGQMKEVIRDSNGYYVVLQNGTNHKVGRTYVDAIKKISL